MGANDFFKLLGAIFLLCWQIIKGLCKLIFWIFTLGKWKLEEAQYNNRKAAEEAARAIAEDQRQAELRSRNTLYGRQK